MAGACAWLPPGPAATRARAEMVAVLANMAESVLAARTAQERVGSGDARGAEGDQLAPGAGRDRVCPPVDPGAGPRAHRVHAAAVRPGRAGGPAGLAGRRDRGDRRGSGPVRADRPS